MNKSGQYFPIKQSNLLIANTIRSVRGHKNKPEHIQYRTSITVTQFTVVQIFKIEHTISHWLDRVIDND